MLYLFDTNIVSNAIREPAGTIAKRILALPSADRAVSIVVAAELRFGAAKRASAVLTKKVELFLAEITVMPFEAPADRCYAELRARLEKAGTPIGSNDLLIAAHALALGATLVTDNLREFSRIKSLKVENWLR
jgi:tRNA(fMet)-specific endonuclease VapC